MRSRLCSCLIMLAICGLFFGAQMARADDDGDENFANELSLDGQASDLLIAPSVDCYLFPKDPTCTIQVEQFGFFPQYNWYYPWSSDGGIRHHRR